MNTQSSPVLQSEASPFTSIATDTEKQQAPSRRAVLAVAVVVFAVVALPLLLGNQPPLVDFPGHLARLKIIDQLFTGGPLSEFYDFLPGFVPNLFFDGVGWTLSQILPLGAVGPAYVIFTLSLQFFGTLALHYVLNGKYSYWPLVAALCVYNLDFFYGYLSFLAGIGLALIGLTLWIACRGRSVPVRLAVGSASAMLLFLAHIIPLIVYASAIAGYELQAAFEMRRRPGAAIKRLCVAAAQFLIPAALFLRDTPTVGLADDSAMFLTEDKIASLLATPTSGSAVTDAWMAGAVVVIAILAALAVRVRFARHFAGAFACVAIAFAVMPWGLGPVVDLDIRMPLALMLLGIAATDVTLRRWVPGVLLVCAIVVVLFIRVSSFSAQTAVFSEHLEAYRAAFARLQPGGILYTAVNDRCPDTQTDQCNCSECLPDSPWSLINEARDMVFPEIYVRRLVIPRHIAGFATIDREVFVPQIFATPGLQPIAVRPSLQAVRDIQDEDPIPLWTAEMLEETTSEMIAAAHAVLPGRPVYLLYQRIEGASELVPKGAEIIARGPQFTLLQLAGS